LVAACGRVETTVRSEIRLDPFSTFDRGESSVAALYLALLRIII
jgi:hypothetical protein